MAIIDQTIEELELAFWKQQLGYGASRPDLASYNDYAHEYYRSVALPLARTANGMIAPSTRTEPIRFDGGKSGDAFFIEEGTTNLCTRPSFEGNLAGWNGGNGAGSSTALSSDRAFNGSQSLLSTLGTGTSDAGAQFSVSGLSVNTTYTASAWIYQPVLAAGVGVRFGVYDSTLSSFTRSAITTVVGNWVRVVVTFTTGPASTIVTLLPAEISAVIISTAQVWIDCVQVEQKPYATTYCDGSLGPGYSWTGAANASTSVRASARLQHTQSIVPGYTIIARGSVAELHPGTTHNFVSLNGGVNVPQLGYNSIVGGVFFSDGVAGQSKRVLTLNTSDKVFIAGTLALDGRTMTVFSSINNEAVVQSTGYVSASSNGTSTTVDVGTVLNGGSIVDGLVEGVVIIPQVLTLAQIEAIRSKGSKQFGSDCSYGLATEGFRTTGGFMNDYFKYLNGVG